MKKGAIKLCAKRNAEDGKMRRKKIRPADVLAERIGFAAKRGPHPERKGSGGRGQQGVGFI